MKSRMRPRRGRPTPDPLPPWWTPTATGTPARVPDRPAPGAPPARAPQPRADPRPPHPAPDDDAVGDAGWVADGVADGPPDDASPPPPPPPPPPGAGEARRADPSADGRARDGLLTHRLRSDAPPSADRHHSIDDEPGIDTGFDTGLDTDMWPDETDQAGTAAGQTQQALPAGHWAEGTDTEGTDTDLWIPAVLRADDATGAVGELAASRPADRDAHRDSGGDSGGDSRRVRTSVDRPVTALRPVSIDEARQLAECFALDYMSCDEDDPQLRRLALAPYLSRHADAMLGWPADRAGVGRQRAIAARAGECLTQGRWVTVDVSVLVEIYQRTGPGPAEPAPERPDLPPDARWSALPPADAPGWVRSMAVWHRLGIPIRRHDSGGLVVELFTVSEPES